jgi:hypothetical protein
MMSEVLPYLLMITCMLAQVSSTEGKSVIIHLSQYKKTYLCLHLSLLRNVNLKYIYEINQVEANFYWSVYVICHTPHEKFEDTKGVIRGHKPNKIENTMA